MNFLKNPSGQQTRAWAQQNLATLQSQNYRSRTISDHSLLRKLTNQAYTNNSTTAGLGQNIAGTNWRVLTDTNALRAAPGTPGTELGDALRGAGNYDAVAYYDSSTKQIVIVNLGADDMGELLRGSISLGGTATGATALEVGSKYMTAAQLFADTVRQRADILGLAQANGRYDVSVTGDSYSGSLVVTQTAFLATNTNFNLIEAVATGPFIVANAVNNFAALNNLN